MKFLPLVLAGLKRKKLRTALTFLSIFVAFLLFAYLGAIKVALSGGVEMAGQDRLIAGHKVSMIQTLPESYLNRIKSVPGVAAVVHQTWFGGIYQDPKNFFGTFPVDPEAHLEMFPKRFVITDAEKKAWLSTRTGAIVGRQIAKKFHWKVGDRIPIQSPIWGQPAGMTQWEFEIVGIYTVAEKNADEASMFFRYDYFEEARQKNKGQVGWFIIRIADPDKAAQVAAAIDKEFENSPYETKTQAEGAMAKGFAQQIGDIGTIVMAVVGAVFFTILLVAGNTMAQSVRERTAELGVLKAVGFTNTRVLVLVLLESCLIAILAGCAGLGVAWLSLLGGSPIPDVLPVLYLPPSTIAAGAGFAVLLGIVAGVLPAWQAMNLKISEALRRGG
ncbi:MAG: FtsX-like permease family protein [Luteolibacter sp.]|uniref:ABC transporter permease n=1 Tax=Luteolibacter sp. TaxID=1962973 RepID=UPI0032679EC3